MSSTGGTRVGILPRVDREAIFRAAKQLQLDPYEFGAFLSLESGPNMDPNVWGGAGKDYYGMIQFGRNERERYLDPRLIGNYTRAEQIPKVVQFLLDRGFKPGKMGVDRAYATVLLGNPNEPLSKQDSFGTSPINSLPRFKPGGDLNANARRVLGDVPAPRPAGIPVERPTQINLPTGQPKKAVVERPPENIFQDLMRGIQKVFGSVGPRRSSTEDYFDQAMALDAAGRTSEAMQYYQAALNEDTAPTQSDNLEEVFSTIMQPAVTYYLDAVEAQKATGPTTQQAPTPGAVATGAANQQVVSLVDFGRQLQKEGLRIGEHPAFGPVGRHSSDKSLHYQDAALDITDWNSGAWKERTKALGALKRKVLGSSAEIYDPGYDPVGGHAEHLHFGLPAKGLSADAANQILEGWRQIKQQYPLR
jgi:hypothetical protein